MKRLEHDFDPTNRAEAMRILEEANARQILLTGLIYINTNQPSMTEIYNLPNTPLNRLTEHRIRPTKQRLDEINELMMYLGPSSSP